MFSTTRNQSSSELQMGRNRNRAPPSPNRDEVPCLDSEGPHQLGEELPITNTALFIIKNITNHHPTVDPFWSWEGPHQLPLQCSYILNSVRFQTKSNLVWKSDSKNVVTIFQTKPSLVWKLKMLSQISKPNPVWFGNFLCRICGGNKFQTKSSLVWIFLEIFQCLTF